uniref:Uncharacterized protein n=1 Tax=Fagus sylvatica TaxID=28930 RepID=A0A2N9I4Y6_FAGSY
MLQSLNPRAALPLGSFSQTGWRNLAVEELRCGVDLAGGGVDSVGLVVELTIGSRGGGGDGVGLTVELGGGADGVIWLFWMIFGWFLVDLLV